MPTIPEFKGQKNVSKKVSTRSVVEDVDGTAQFLQTMGGAAEKFGNELLKKRKKAEDLRDASDRSLQLSVEWMKKQGELKKASSEDGLIDPTEAKELGLEPNEEGKPLTYADGARQFWDKSIDRFSEGAASSESKQMFLNQARPQRNESILKADGRTQQLRAASRVKDIQEQGNLIRNTLLTQKDIDLDTVMDNFRAMDQSIVQARKNGHIGDATEKELLSAQKRKMGSALVENFIRNNKGGDVLQMFSVALNQLSTKASKKNIEGLKPKDFINEEVSQLRENLKSIGIESSDDLSSNRDFNKSALDLASMVNEISHPEILKYLQKATDIVEENGNFSASALAKEKQNFSRQAMRGEINTSDPEGRSRARNLFNLIKDFGNQSKAEKGIRLAEVALLPSLGETVQKMEKMSPEQMQKEIETARNIDLGKTVKDFDPEFFKEIEGFLEDKSFSIDEIRDKIGDKLKKQAVTIQKRRQENPAEEVFRINPRLNDPELPAEQRIQIMENTYDQWGLLGGSRNFVPKSGSAISLENVKGEIANATSDEDRAAVIMGARNFWGDEWLTVVNEYAQQDGIPDSVAVAQYAQTPNQMSNIITRLGGRGSDAIANFKSRDTEGANTAALDLEINDHERFAQFQRAINSSDGFRGKGPTMVRKFRKALRAEAMVQASSTGENKDIDEAVEGAFEKIIGSGFNVAEDGNSSVMIPKSAGVPTDRVQTFIDEFSDADNLAKINKKIDQFAFEEIRAIEGVEAGELSTKQIRDRFNQLLEDQGRWTTSPNFKGLILELRTDSGNFEPIKTPEGEPVGASWEEIGANETVAESLQGFFGG